MKFLVIILAIRIVFMLLDKIGAKKVKEDVFTGIVRHPAEFELR
jgi:hypothetical protein